MLSLKEDDHEYFIEIFNFITILLQNEEIIKKLTSIHDFQDFINILIDKKLNFTLFIILCQEKLYTVNFSENAFINC